MSRSQCTLLPVRCRTSRNDPGGRPLAGLRWLYPQGAQLKPVLSASTCSSAARALERDNHDQLVTQTWIVLARPLLGPQALPLAIHMPVVSGHLQDLRSGAATA